MQEICKLDDLPDGEGRGFDIELDALLLIRRGEQVFAYRNNCPHRGIRLEWQPDQFLDYEKQYIQCATHGALFTIDEGECIAGPCPGEKLDQLRCRVEEGKVLVDF
ncbi:Rieske (2Fe-2S) protein [Marinobacterium mangrovicola]|uniref:Nitrite reductase/ring-hydroxylating ferredoxin subunit n=1 Tax=Marinobacterium mangrovicola TaxID=1476959 RepID=A0A4R1GGF3_9GAMM|nr:Rieske (2Fe-2S) protein [Marinobacterium mangrovicola]TCK04989.1 nitrite reductase/ring-hydroxylating ferredoxin subunit [Marinobacterium mangrovicola]